MSCHMRTPVAGDHGLLQIRRTNGEATVPYKAPGSGGSLIT